MVAISLESEGNKLITKPPGSGTRYERTALTDNES